MSLLFACIASGPSLNQEQIDILGSYKDKLKMTIIGINDNWKWKFDNDFIVDHLYAADESWWKVWNETISSCGFNGQKWIPRDIHVAEKYNLNCIPCENKPGLGLNGKIHLGGNSGYQAINLAVHLGAKTIILLGYDMKLGNDKKLHWFGNHGNGLRNMPHKLNEWIPKHDELKKDLDKHKIDVVNCTPDSALYQYRKENLEKSLDELLDSCYNTSII